LRRAQGPQWRETLVAELAGGLGEVQPASTARPLVSALDNGCLAARRHKLRREFRECLRQEVRAKLPKGACVDAELRRLHLALLSREQPPATLAVLSPTRSANDAPFDTRVASEFPGWGATGRCSPHGVTEPR
jgi:hypothetical protein